jgi:hypothetical protein|tara:strand:+ start:1067 stop:1705 length:639 start_codon:yes stop_codon:yes gene_type:complete
VSRTFEFAGPAGRLEALLDEPDGGREPLAAVVMAHPHPEYGGTMHTKVVFRAAKAFQRIGCAVLRFNFRGVGVSDGIHDGGDGERDDFRAALELMAGRYPTVELWAAGFSFGAWVALTVGATSDRVALVFGIAPPVAHQSFAELRCSSKPKFFIQGERDELCALKDMWRLYGELNEPKELVVIDGADHLFDGKTLEVGDAIEDLLGDWKGAP